ncbi:MAG: hypothetical protein JWO13_1413 [Acidobacteriales bacterium]|nr:hypothetical protein [Terriglobales bacterium]
MNEERKAALVKVLPPICLVMAVVSVFIGLWCVREFEQNRWVVGYGDADAHSYFALLWWTINVLIFAIVGCCAAASIFSRRALISIVGGVALTVGPILLANWVPTGILLRKAVYFFEFPAVFAVLSMVGVHGGGDWRANVFGVCVSATFYSVVTYVLVARRMAK